MPLKAHPTTRTTKMHKTRYLTICVAIIAAAVATAAHPARAADDQAAAQDKEAQLIGVLQSDAPKAEKAITCKRLAIYGGKDAVPALAALLPDEQLTSWARIALEVIPGRESWKAAC
jgi:pimeloyl-ACP methyl ester carboxylesterase